MSEPDLRLLGPPLLTAVGRPAEHLRRKSIALIAYLAVEHHPHGRDALSTLLWPECGQSRARANLRVSLYALNDVLGRGAIASTQDTLALESGRLTVDVDAFHHLAGGCGRHEPKQVCDDCLDVLERAEKTYRDDFLVGFSLPECTAFDHWQLLQADRLRGELADVLNRMVAAYEARGRIPLAIQHAKRLLALDPLEESSHRTLIRLYAMDGRRAVALRQFEDCCRILKEELDAEPDEETVALVTEVREKRFAASRGAGAEAVPRQPRTEPARAAATGKAASAVWSAAQRDVVLLAARFPDDIDGSPRESAIEVDGGERITVAGLPFASLYPTAAEASAAALEAQSRYGGGLRLIVHAGTVEQIGPRYFGPGIGHGRALLAACLPGIILMSGPAMLGLKRSPQQPFSFRSLGKHRLADLGHPETLYQVVHAGEEPEPPRLPTLDAKPNNLSSQDGPFIGRQHELSELTSLLEDERFPVLTLTGTAGVGKTRLALHVAAGTIHRFEHGAFFVNLASVGDHRDLLKTIAATLGVRETMGRARAIAELLKDYLQRRHILLILDNFEHLLPAAAEVVPLCDAAPGLKLVVTSRQRLGIHGERQYVVAPLGLPQPGADAATLLRSDATRLFLSRGAAARPDLEVTAGTAAAIGEVCVRLDGLPLAIELAASRLKILSPLDLARLLPQRLGVLKSDVDELPARQRTLERAIDWSYDLLPDGERRLFTALAVFVGGWTLESAEAVCASQARESGNDVLDLMASLVDKSLIRTLAGTRGNHLAMYETIREYALHKLHDDPRGGLLRERHALYFLAFAEEAEQNLYRVTQMEWLDRLETEYGNLGAALRWFLDEQRPIEALRMCNALEWFWYRYGHFSDARSWLTEALAAAQATNPATNGGRRTPATDGSRNHSTAVITGRAFGVLGWFLHVTGEWPRARDLYSRSLRAAVELDDRPNEIRSLSNLGGLERWLGETSEGKKHVGMAVRLAREEREPQLILRSLIWAYSTNGGRDLGASPRVALEEALRLAQSLGDLWSEAHASNGLGDLLTRQGKYQAARIEYERALAGFRRLKDDWLAAWTLEGLGRAALLDQDYPGAEEYTRESIKLFAELGDPVNVIVLFRRLATALWYLGDSSDAATLFGAFEGLRAGLPAGAERTSGARLYREARGAARTNGSAEWAQGRSMNFREALAYSLGGSAL